MSATVAVTCFQCGHQMEFSESLSFREECAKCGADLHVCKNCKFYDPGAYNECREPQAEVVREKERANYCDYFQASAVDKKPGTEREELWNAAEALFKSKNKK